MDQKRVAGSFVLAPHEKSVHGRTHGQKGKGMGKRTFLILLLIMMNLDLYASSLLLNEDFSPVSLALAGASISQGGPEIDRMLTNPAGINSIQGFHYQIGWSGMVSYELGINYEYILVGFPLPKKQFGSLGVSFFFFSLGDEAGIYDETGARTGTLQAEDYMVQLCYANILKKLKFGLNIKYFQSRLEDVPSSGAALDLGVIYPVHLSIPGTPAPEDNLSLGLGIENIGTEKGYYTRKDLPMKVKAGVGYKIIPGPVLMNWLFEILAEMDYNTLDYRDTGYFTEKLGLDIDLSRNFSLRLGYRFDNTRGTNAFSLGLGLNYTFHKLCLGFDYGVAFLDLSSKHCVAVRGSF